MQTSNFAFDSLSILSLSDVFHVRGKYFYPFPVKALIERQIKFENCWVYGNLDYITI